MAGEDKVTALQEAIAARLAPILDFRVHSRIPDQIVPPCAWVQPDPARFIDYQQVFLGALQQWRFRLVILASATSIVRAQESLAAHLDPQGDVISALHANGMTDALQSLTNGFIKVIAAGGFSGYPVGGASYLSTFLTIQLKA